MKSAFYLPPFFPKLMACTCSNKDTYRVKPGAGAPGGNSSRQNAAQCCGKTIGFGIESF